MNKNSINKKLLFYLSSFVFFIIILLFILQTVALEWFYKRVKQNDVVKVSDIIIRNIDSDVHYYIDEVSSFENLAISLFDEDGNLIMSTFKTPMSIEKMSIEEIADLYEKTDELITKKQFIVSEHNQMYRYGANNKNFSKNEFLLFTQVSDEKDVMVVIEAMLSPVSATKYVLKIQLLYVSLILIISAGMLAYILSKKITRPIIKINEEAKNLINGNYNLTLEKNDYKEISELNDTMISTSLELKKADKMQKDLIANISHDLRTPLTMIIGYAEVMRDIPQENNSENIQIIIDEAKRLNNLVNDILIVSKLQNDKFLNLETINITTLTKNIIERAKKMIEKDNYVFDFLYDEDIFVSIDELKISQVIYNLIGNAITHTGDDKKITISQTIIGKKVRISISDTGKGIDESEISNIWDRYYKINEYHNRSNVGTGLGLSIVKDIIIQHNGSYGVDSKINEGSTFWFEISI